MFIIKFFIYFSISFTILSFPIGNKSIFFHLNQVAKPYTQKVFKMIGSNVESGLQEGSVISKKLFSNSLPTEDKIKSSLSSMSKKIPIKKKMEGEYTVEEKQMLNKVLEFTE